MKALSKLFYLAAFFSILISSCTSGKTVSLNPKEPVHLKVGTYNYISSAPYYIARDEGFFAEQGLDVELINFGSSSSEIIPALLSKQLDATAQILSVSILNAILEGNNIKFVADRGYMNPDNCVTDAWMATSEIINSGDLDKPSSIMGKTVNVTKAGTIEFTLDKLLEEKQISKNDINLVYIADSAARIESLKNGSMDISVLSEPWLTKAEEAGIAEIWTPLTEIVPGMTIGVTVFGPTLLEMDPAVGTAFMKAYIKAIAQFNDGKTDRNVEIIANYTKLSPEDIKSSCWTSFKPDASIDPKYLDEFQKWALEKGYINGEVEIDQMYTSLYVDNAKK